MQFMIKAHAFHAFVTAEISNFMGLSQLPGGKKVILKPDRLCRDFQIIIRVDYSKELRWIEIGPAESA